MRIKELARHLYKELPYKREVFSLIKFFWVPPESIYQHLHFKGVITVKPDDSHKFKMVHYGYMLENSLFWSGIKGGWEKESVDVWIKLVTKSDVIIDIGANTGIYSLIAKSLNPDSKIYAFEPVERVYHKLLQNIYLNNFGIIAFKEAVSDMDGTAVIYDPCDEHIYSVTLNKNQRHPDTKVVETIVPTISLSSFIEQNNLSKIDLMKIDVESHEPEVLVGMGKYLKLFRPTILIEILDDELGVEIERIIYGMGYLYFNIDENGSIRQVDKLTHSDYYNFLLCNQSTAVELGLLNG